MCVDPATMAMVSMGMQAFGAVKGFQADKAAGKAAQNSANYNAAVSRNNAIIAQRNAQLAAQEGNAEVAAKQAETKAKIGAIAAQQGGSGVNMNTGSAVDVRSSASQTGQLSALNIRSSAVRKVYGYKQQESDYLSQAGLQEAEGKNARTAGDMNATTTLLGGLSQAGISWADYNKNANL